VARRRERAAKILQVSVRSLAGGVDLAVHRTDFRFNGASGTGPQGAEPPGTAIRLGPGRVTSVAIRSATRLEATKA
jgi:hypothetical protein